MIQDKGHYTDLPGKKLPTFSLLFFLGLIYLVFPELCFGDRSGILISQAYSVSIDKPGISLYETFSVKWHFNDEDSAKKHSEKESNSQPLSDPTILKEGHRGFTDKGPEPDMLAFSGVYIGNPILIRSFIYNLPLSPFPLWTGYTLKIRPPPFL